MTPEGVFSARPDTRIFNPRRAKAPAGDYHSLFILFAPYDHPQIAIAVMVENAEFGASVTGPTASLMAEQFLTGQIAATPEREWVVFRVPGARSEPISKGIGK